jgi:secreted trypsin-like serine protease
MKQIFGSMAVAFLMFLTACGVSDSARLKIINGVKVTADDPVMTHTAALVTESGFLSCSVAAITPNVFITAAHCVHLRNVTGWTIRTGSTAGDSETQDVEQAITHEGFNPALLPVEDPDTAPNDLAIIKTTQSSSALTPVDIIPSNVRTSLTAPFEITIAGYGRTEPRNSNSKGVLYKTTVSVKNQNTATKEFTSQDAAGKMACHGDSGGPAFYKNGDVYVLIGVISRGTTTCDESTTFYTDAAAFKPFIDQISGRPTNLN